MQYVYKKRRILCSKLLKKLQKDSCEKCDQRKSGRIMEFLPFITLCKSFQPKFSFLASNFAFYDTQIEFLQQIFLAYIRIQLYIHFRPGRLHFDKKSKNRCTLVIRWSDVPNIFQRFLLLSSLSEFYQEGQVYESGLRSVFEAAKKSSF
jgi:hypothetical protein